MVDKAPILNYLAYSSDDAYCNEYTLVLVFGVLSTRKDIFISLEGPKR